MNGTGINIPSYSPALYGAGPVGESLLASLSRHEPPPAGENPVAALERALRTEAEQGQRLAARPDVRGDLSRFARALARAETPAALLGHPVALKVLLTAHGLGDQVANRGFAMKALLPDPAAPGALVDRLMDSRWRALARVCAFAVRGLAALREPRAVEAVSRGYAEAVWRREQERTTPGLADALTFVRRAPAIFGVRQIQHDPVVDAVVTLALDVPEARAFPNAIAREQAIADRLDVTRFRDARFVRQLAEIYLVARAADARMD